MKKLLSIAVIAAVFGLVGCSAQEKPNATMHQDSISNTISNVKAGTHHKQKCHGKKCHHKDKLGEEQVKKDVVK